MQAVAGLKGSAAVRPAAQRQAHKKGKENNVESIL